MDIRNQKVTVVGLGRTSLALVRLLLREGAKPFVTDSGSGPRLEGFRRELEAMGVPSEAGGHSEEAFRGARLVIPSPGVPPGIEPIRRAAEAGAEVVGEMEFAYPYCRSHILAVTGTNGKTTTTELLRALVEASGHSVLLAGNNALPFSGAVQIEPAPEYIVLEVSSYQLETSRRFRPWIGAVLNVTPDHLARHGTMEGYAAVKARMLTNQGPDDFAVLNADDPFVSAMAGATRATVWSFSLERMVDPGLWLDRDTIRQGGGAVARANDTRLPGRHNLQNVLCALSMMRAGGFEWEGVLEGLRGFRGVEHRIEHVRDIDGVAYYNDSKSTNIDSLKVALESFDVPVVLIAGGRGKGADYRPLRELVARRVKALVTLGEDAPLLEEAFGDVVPAERATDMADAVRRAAAAARPGETVLLSPACASFDMYDDFEHRGRVFKEIVAQCEEKVSP
jgi:UDP-N-acetylmuramoylalanine--D-glutamate ligase